MLVTADLRCVSQDVYIFFGNFLGYNFVKFHHCRICVTDFREGVFLPNPPSPAHPWAAPKKPIMNRVNEFEHFKETKILWNIGYNNISLYVYVQKHTINHKVIKTIYITIYIEQHIFIYNMYSMHIDWRFKSCIKIHQ